MNTDDNISDDYSKVFFIPTYFYKKTVVKTQDKAASVMRPR